MNAVVGRFIDKVYRFAVSRNKVFRVVAGALSRFGLIVLSAVTRFWVSSDRSLTEWHMLLGSYEKGTITYLQRTVKPGMVAVDIGAHVGFFTRHLSKLVGSSGSVIAFEAHPQTYELLGRNCRRLQNVSLVNAAVTSFDGETTLFDSGGSTGSNSLISARSDYKGSNAVRATRLDTHLAGRTVDLVKIDVEGAELDVLDGMKAILAASPRISIIVELFPPVWKDHPEGRTVLLDRLAAIGLQSSVIADDGSLVPAADWPSASALLDSVPKYVNILATKPAQTLDVGTEAG